MTRPPRSRAMSFRQALPGRLKEIALTVGAVGGLACIVLAVCAVVFGLTPLIVQSGSMAPTVTTGSLLITQKTPASELKRGDVVTVPRPDRTLVTHRIVRLTLRGDTATLRLKGDANDVMDPQAYVVKHAGRLVIAIPFVGRVAAWASSGLGLFLLGLYVAFLGMVVAADWRDRRGGGGRRGAARAVAVAGAVLLGAMAAPVAAPRPAFAAWTDGATAGTSTLTAHVVPKSSSFTCGTLGLGSVRVNWTAVSEATSYTVFYNSGASSTAIAAGTTTYQITGASGGSKTAWVVANRNFGGTTWTSVASNTRTYSITLGLLGVCS